EGAASLADPPVAAPTSTRHFSPTRTITAYQQRTCSTDSKACATSLSYIERQQFVVRAADPGDRSMPGVVCEAAFAGSGRAGVLLEAQLQAAGRDVDAHGGSVAALGSGRPAVFIVHSIRNPHGTPQPICDLWSGPTRAWSEISDAGPP